MRGFVYVSEESLRFSPEDLSGLERRAREFNTEVGVTGYLYRHRGRFVQYVEGPASGVDEVVERVLSDERHTVLRSLTRDSFERRLFPGWSMRCLDRRQFVEIQMEHILSDKLLLMHKHPEFLAEWDVSTWSTVEAVASVRGLLGEVS